MLLELNQFKCVYIDIKYLCLYIAERPIHLMDIR